MAEESILHSGKDLYPDVGALCAGIGKKPIGGAVIGALDSSTDPPCLMTEAIPPGTTRLPIFCVDDTLLLGLVETEQGKPLLPQTGIVYVIHMRVSQDEALAGPSSGGFGAPTPRARTYPSATELLKRTTKKGVPIPNPVSGTSSRGTCRVSLTGGRSAARGPAFMPGRSYRHTQLHAAGPGTPYLHSRAHLTSGPLSPEKCDPPSHQEKTWSRRTL